jgi:hypothetical protein
VTGQATNAKSVAGRPVLGIPFCHEVWSYHERTGVQRLEGFIALCDFCHEVKHIGLARKKGRERAALAHLAKVNGWPGEERPTT